MLCALMPTALGQRALDADFIAAVAWDKVDWSRLVRVSGVHLLTPALDVPLADPAMRDRVPPELHLYLDAMRDAATQRNLALRGQLEQVATCLNEIDVVPVLLKGAIRLVDGLWPDPALRFMHDLDLLVPEADLWACVARLTRSGWRPYDAGRQDLAQHVIMIHPDAVTRIELHRLPLSAPYGDLLPAVRMLARAAPLRFGETVVALPSLEDQLVHLVAHGMLQHAFLSNGRFVLRDLIEFKLLVGRAGSRELAAARERFATAGHLLAWDVSLELCGRCLGGATAGKTLTGRALAARMLLQQRWAWAMLLFGPMGWLAARLLVNRSAKPLPLSPRQLAGRLKVFRRKTLW